MRVKFIFLLLVVLLSTAALAGEDDIDLGWYALEEWELAVCQDTWGGPQSLEGETSDTGGYSIDIYTNDIIITLQAEIGDPIPINGTDFGRIYEISWYIQPVWTSVNFEVAATNADGDIIDPPIASSSASMESGYSGYQAIVQPEDITLASVILTVPEAGISLEMPFVDFDTMEDQVMEYWDLVELPTDIAELNDLMIEYYNEQYKE